MKKRALNKDFRMEIKKSMNRFLSILLIVALGVAFFAGIQSAAPDMRVTEDAYFDDANLMDIRVMGTFGLTGDDLDAIRDVDGVELVSGAYMEDVYSGDEESLDVLHVESLTDTLNEVAVTAGEMPTDAGECFLDEYYAGKVGLKPGDVLEIWTGDGEDTTLIRQEFTVAGLGYSPTYIAFTRGSTTLGTGSLDGFVYVLPEAFDTDIYGVAYVKVDGAEEELAYTDEYDDTVAEVLDRIEEIEDAQCEVRYTEVKEQAESELAQARIDVADGKEELADAEAELADARIEVEEGESEYEEGKAEFDENADLLQDAKEQLADAKTQLNDGEEDFHDGLIEYLQEGLSGMQELHLAGSRLSSGRAEADEGWAEYESGAAEAASGEAELADARQQLYDAQAQYDAGAAQLAEGQNTYNESAAQVEEGRAELDAAREELASGQSDYENGRAELDAAWAEYNAGAAELAAGWAEYYTNEAEVEAGLQAYNSAVAQVDELRSGTASAEAGVSSLQTALESANAAYNNALAYLNSLDPDSDEYAAAQAAVDAAAAQVSELSGQLGTAQAAAEALEAALAEAEAQLNAQAGEIGRLEAAQSELAAAKAELDAGQTALDEALTELNANEAALAEAKAQLDAGEAEIAENEGTLAAGEAQLASGWDEIVSGQAELDAAASQISSGWSEVYAGEAELAEGNEQLSDALIQLNDAEAQLASGNAEVDAGYDELYNAWEELRDARAELDDGWDEYHSSYEEYSDGKQELRDARQQLKDAKQELDDGKAELADGEQEIEDARTELADGEQKIADGEKELEDLDLPSWYVSDRSVLPDNTGYGENADRMTSIATIFPVLFFLVAALISLTTMTRMVEEERTQIGTLKALGYGKYDIAKKYLKYAFWATVLGSMLGILGGEKLLPWVIIVAYGIMYQYQPQILLPYNWGFGLAAAAMAMISTLGAALWSCYRALGTVPAELMRPPTPKQGKRVFLERVTFIWNRLNFNWKSTVRNLMRYKSRALMMILGIGGCMGLLLVGYGLRDSIMDVVLLQYDELQTYDAILILDTDAPAEEIAEIKDAVAEDSRITSYSNFYMQSLDIAQPDAQDSGKEWSIYLYVPEDMDDVGDFLTFRNRRTGEEYSLTDENAIITEKITQEFGLSSGDTIALDGEDETVEVPIGDICENYMSHYLYLTPQLYEELFGEAPGYNSIFFSTDGDEAVLDQIGTSLLSYDAALNISYTYELRKQVEDMLSALDLVILVLIISAGLLAFVVLYNLNNININERIRELATLKVLGFHDIEVANYIYRENIVLTILGAAAGCGIGKWMHGFIIKTVEVDSTMFGRTIYPQSYALGTLITFAFAVIVNFAMYFKLKKIDMIESLKSTE